MATTFPNSIQNFTDMVDISSTDGSKVEQFMGYMNSGDIASANTVLRTIPNYDQKILTAERMNTVTDTCYAVQKYFADRYSNGYIVSETQPTAQDVGDFWFQVVT